MGLDEANHPLFVATRKPPSLLVFDTQAGTRTADLPIASDADDLFYDAKRKRLYVICGDGVVDIVEQKDADHYERAGEVRTVRGARGSRKAIDHDGDAFVRRTVFARFERSIANA